MTTDDKTLYIYGNAEVFTPSEEDLNAIKGLKGRRKSKIFVRAKFTQCGVKNSNNAKILLDDVKEALPTLKNSYIRAVAHNTGPIIGTCYDYGMADENDPLSMVYASYVVWNTPDNRPYVEQVLKSHMDDSMGVSYETLYDHAEADEVDGSNVLRGPLEFAGALFTKIPAYATTLGFLSIAEAEECLITGDSVDTAATDADKAAQESRSKKYNISIRQGGNITKPSQFEDVQESDFADPVNFAYPCHDQGHTQSALHYWGMDRNKGKYSSNDQKVVEKRLMHFAKKFGIETNLEVAVDERIKELEVELATNVDNASKLQDQIVQLSQERDDWKKKYEDIMAAETKKQIQATRLAELGELAEADVDYSSMSDLEFKCYRLERENAKLRNEREVIEAAKVEEPVVDPVESLNTETVIEDLPETTEVAETEKEVLPPLGNLESGESKSGNKPTAKSILSKI